MIRKGDDTNAFDQEFLEVRVKDADKYTISKAELRIGSIIKTFENPVFPIKISLTREETMMLSTCSSGNDCYLAVYDDQNRKKTLEGTTNIPVAPRVV